MKVRAFVVAGLIAAFSKLASAEIFVGYLIDLNCGNAQFQRNGTLAGVNDPKCIRDGRDEHNFAVLADDSSHTLYLLGNEYTVRILNFVRNLSDEQIHTMRVALSGTTASKATLKRWVDPAWIRVDQVGAELDIQSDLSCNQAPHKKVSKRRGAVQIAKRAGR